MLRTELKRYEESFGYMTPEERKELREWVKKDNSVYSNPWHMADEDGRLMDYITAVRINDDMCDNPGNYNFGGIIEYDENYDVDADVRF
jgi:hypothetical protein